MSYSSLKYFHIRNVLFSSRADEYDVRANNYVLASVKHSNVISFCGSVCDLCKSYKAWDLPVTFSGVFECSLNRCSLPDSSRSYAVCVLILFPVTATQI